MPLDNLKPRTSSAVVRNMLGQIEEALERGASRESIWKTLQKEHGLVASFEGFCKALTRARAARQKSEKVQANPMERNGKGSAEKLDCAIQKETDSMDCTIQKEAPKPAKAQKKTASIKTTKEILEQSESDFREYDDRYK